jgi:hypothetical protein
MRVFLDESGCLGFTFTEPYLKGGSSRFLCLAFAIVPKPYYKIPPSIIAGLYKKYGWKNEKKACPASDRQKAEFAKLVVEMVAVYPDIKTDCIIEGVPKDFPTSCSEDIYAKLLSYFLELQPAPLLDSFKSMKQ